MESCSRGPETLRGICLWDATKVLLANELTNAKSSVFTEQNDPCGNSTAQSQAPDDGNESCNTDTTQTQPHQISNTQRTENKTTDVTIQQHSRKLLIIDILMSETC